jgi:hypothetical protein
VDTILSRDREGPRDEKPAEDLERMISDMSLMRDDDAEDSRKEFIHNIHDEFEVRN